MYFNILFLSALLSVISWIGFPLSTFADDEDSEKESAYDSVRIENEYKLFVPPGTDEDVWKYLIKRYSEDNSYLKKQSAGFVVKLSEENFIDRYFDSPDLKMLNMKSGLRHRTRFNTDNPEDRKNGRSLVQLKLNHLDSNELNRGEIKYKVNKKVSDPLNSSLSGLLKSTERSQLGDRLKPFGLEVSKMSEKLKIFQRRRRVYIEHNGAPFATITLDQVQTKRFWVVKDFTEVEIELNEVNFTKASESQRKAMAKVSALIKKDLLAQFPAIKQDQTPKYNKAYAAIESDGKTSRFLLKYF